MFWSVFDFCHTLKTFSKDKKNLLGVNTFLIFVYSQTTCTLLAITKSAAEKMEDGSNEQKTKAH